MSDNKSLDLLGIKPISDAINKVTSASVDAATALFNRICLPAAEEYGLFLRDRVHGFRSRNIAAIAEKAEQKLATNGSSESAHASPRLFSRIIEEASWIEDSEVQEMWAGLLATSCTDAGDDDSNLPFTNFLAGLTKMQAKILRYACENAKKDVTRNGLIEATPLLITPKELIDLTGEHDIERLDRELDHLRYQGLLATYAGGFSTQGDLTANLTPSALALHMYVRCQGARVSTLEYFGLTKPTPAPG